MKRYRMSNMQVIALGFFLIIMVGTLLLKLPFATRSGESASWLTALLRRLVPVALQDLLLRILICIGQHLVNLL